MRSVPAAAVALAVAATALLGITGCGDSDSGSSSSTGSTTSTTTQATNPPQEVSSLGVRVISADGGAKVVAVNALVAAQGAKSTLQEGDLITTVNGKPAVSAEHLAKVAGEPVLGQEVRVKVERGTHTFPIAVVYRPKSFLGVQVQDTTAGTPGAVVVDVVKKSPAEAAGIQKADVITAVDGTRTKLGQAVTAAVAAYDPGDKVTITLVRGSDEMNVTATLAPQPGIGG